MNIPLAGLRITARPSGPLEKKITQSSIQKIFTCSEFSKSRQNVLRGLHGDEKTWKLITCVFGEVFFVVVGNRSNSDSYLNWDSWILSDSNRLQVLVPPRFVNGHLVLSETAVFHYQMIFEGKYNDIDKQFTLRWNDPMINIDWLILV